jgi:hypothetical protein
MCFVSFASVLAALPLLLFEKLEEELEEEEDEEEEDDDEEEEGLEEVACFTGGALAVPSAV